MTVDVEEYFHVSAFARDIDPKTWGDLKSRVVQSVSRILDIFDDHDLKGTFFVLGWVAARHPQLVRRIFDRGHEIACHGYSHQLIYNQSYKDFEIETLMAKKLLEDTIGQPVIGYRAASYSITQDSLWALDILCEAEFKYDSSIFPVHHDTYGIRNANRYPHIMTLESGKEITEFPITTFRLGPIQLPVGGGGYFRLYPYQLSRFTLASINRNNAPFIFYMHPWEIDPDQPRVKSNFLSTFRHYNNIEKFEPRLKKLLRDFRFARVDKVLQNAGLL